jgi:hypothetical protein
MLNRAKLLGSVRDVVADSKKSVFFHALDAASFSCVTQSVFINSPAPREQGASCLTIHEKKYLGYLIGMMRGNAGKSRDYSEAFQKQHSVLSSPCLRSSALAAISVSISSLNFLHILRDFLPSGIRPLPKKEGKVLVIQSLFFITKDWHVVCLTGG